ncbi:mycofactocin biosynthesis peptidyl-dipeptidase MftE [Agromyces bauzanensis]|uniref:Mycofactocin system creatininase family protein n=1 Tax=Agromyces bauzanensis TaxID=1308924 RepID=A0A917UPQ8_9MICO|nr:mycofactocin biosynthesis peptidyl-dipeptidase MftE [Agromyces bauzanensis]GGJ72902.1 mycofactocin system creatininase family protein [Agromyces bauzanensis]
MTERDARHLADRPWPEVGRPVLLVPLGSTEQHGPHLPLDTDTAVASVVCDALAERLAADGVDAAVAPAIPYGASGEHQDFPGTVSIGTEALTLLLVEYGRSACEWAARLVFVNGHGGNVEAFAAAVPKLIAEGRAVSWLPCAADAPGDPHAGRTETSLMLATDPARVLAERVEPGNDAPLAELMAELRAGGVRRVSPNGVLGDPRGATAEEGERLLDAIVAHAWSRFSGGVVDDRGCLVSAPSGAAS